MLDQTMPFFKKIVLISALLITVSGCFTPNTTGDSPVVGSSIIAIDINGTEVSTTISSDSGNYVLKIADTADYEYPLILVSTGGTDLVTNKAPDFKLKSIIFQPHDDIANINVFSTLIVEVASTMQGGISRANLRLATSYVLDNFNFGFNKNAIKSPIQTVIDLNNVAMMIKSSESFEEALRRTQLKLTLMGNSMTIDEIIGSLAIDINDEKLDGVGNGPAIDPKIAATFTIVSSEILLETLTDQLLIDEQDATSIMNNAIQVTKGASAANISTSDVPLNNRILEQAIFSIDTANILAPDAELSMLSAEIETIIPGVLPDDISSQFTSEMESALSSAVNSLDAVTESQISLVIEKAFGNNQAPVFTTLPNQNVREGEMLSFTVNATDLTTPVLSADLSALSSATFDATTGLFNWTPTNGDVGNYSVTFYATDSDDSTLEVSKIILIRVDPPLDMLAVGTPEIAPSGGEFPTQVGISMSTTTVGAKIYYTTDGETPTRNSLEYMGPFNLNLSATIKAAAFLTNYIDSETRSVDFQINQTPVLNAIGEQTIEEGETLDFIISATNTDVSNPLFSTSQLPPGATFDAQARRFTWITSRGDEGNYSVTFYAQNSDDPSLQDSETINVKVNAAPIPTVSTPIINPLGGSFTGSVEIAISSTTIGATIHYTIDGHDPTRTSQQYTTPFNLTSSATVKAIAFRTDYVDSNPSSAAFEITQPNQAPTLNPIGNQNVNEGETLQFIVSANDPDATTPILSVDGLPTGATFTNGNFSWTPASGDANTYNLTFRATDAEDATLNVSQAMTIQVDAVIVPDVSTPSITPEGGNYIDEVSVSMNTSTAGAAIYYTLDGSEPTESSQLYTSPFTLTESREIRAAGFLADYTDSSVRAANFVITLNETPVLNAIGNKALYEGQTLNFTISATDSDGSNPVLSASGLPTGASFSTAGSFNWVTSSGDEGVYQVTFTATDAANAALDISETITIAVNPPLKVNAVNILPAGGSFDNLVSINLSTATTGADIYYTTDDSNPTSDSQLYSGAFDLTRSATIRTIAFLTDYIDSDISSAIFVINQPDQPPILTPVGNQNISEGETLSFTISATDPDSEIPPTLSINSLPPGATFNVGTGEFSWETSRGDKGNYSVVFTATDSQSLQDSEVVSIRVNQLAIDNTSQSAYEWFTLSVGTNVFVDESFTYTTIPPQLVGLDALRTANNDNLQVNDTFLSFNISVSTIVYVALDTRLATPSWMSDWNSAGLIITDTDTSRSLYNKTFAAGAVMLGGNEGINGASMYTVMVRSEAGIAVPVAVSDSASTDMETTININVLENDSGLDDAPITLSIIDDPGVGDLTIEDDSIRFTPDGESVGSFTIIYQIEDNDGDSATASVNLTIACNLCADDIDLVLSWDANPTEENVQGYRVAYRKNSEQAIALSDISVSSDGFDPANPEVTYNAGLDMGLVIGDTVCVTVSAFNTGGTSDASSEVCSDID